MTIKAPYSRNTSFVASVMDVYSQYVKYGYPKDPAVYVIKAGPKTCKEIKKSMKIPQFTVNSPHTFLSFRVETDPRLEEGEVVFGPETVELKWRLS